MESRSIRTLLAVISIRRNPLTTQRRHDVFFLKGATLTQESLNRRKSGLWNSLLNTTPSMIPGAHALTQKSIDAENRRVAGVCLDFFPLNIWKGRSQHNWLLVGIWDQELIRSTQEEIRSTNCMHRHRKLEKKMVNVLVIIFETSLIRTYYLGHGKTQTSQPCMYNKGSKHEAGNYTCRSVSLTSIHVCKILESNLTPPGKCHSQVHQGLSLIQQQFGFIGGRATSLQLIKVLAPLDREILDRGGCVDPWSTAILWKLSTQFHMATSSRFSIITVLTCPSSTYQGLSQLKTAESCG